MTVALLESPITEAVRSLEVRWIFPGKLEPGMAEWFARFPAVREARQDSYLVDPQLRGLSVKVRAGRALEVKAYHGSPGVLDVPGRAGGHLQCWQKWSFPFAPPGLDGERLAGWQPVNKRRRITRFSLAAGRAVPAGPDLAGEPGCAVELTEAHADGQVWWSLGCEATGPDGLLRSGLEATAALVFAQPLPGGVKLGTDDSRSVAEWLTLRPAPGRG
jgi:hypothetical protein